MPEMPEPPADTWFNDIAAFLGDAYWAPDTTRVQAFTTGTEQEVSFLVESMGLVPGARVLDVGCGPGRHALALAARGFDVLGVDASPEFVALAESAAAGAGSAARFAVLDVRSLEHDSAFDAVICLCQGGFGLLGGRGEYDVLARMARSLRPGGALALSAFSAAFALRHLEESESFDPATGVLYERVLIRNGAGEEREFDAWTTCFTARELQLMAESAGLVVEHVSGVSPGRYRIDRPTVDDHELLLLARKQGQHSPEKTGTL